MTKETYLKLRNNNDVSSILYAYYSEKTKKDPLPISQFLQLFNLWLVESRIRVEDVLKKLDVKHKVTAIEEVNGMVIKYI